MFFHKKEIKIRLCFERILLLARNVSYCLELFGLVFSSCLRSKKNVKNHFEFFPCHIVAGLKMWIQHDQL